MRMDKDLKDFKTISGTYVNAGNIISKMSIPVLDLSDEETEMYYKILKKVISGKDGRNSVNIEFFEPPKPEDIISNLELSNYCILQVDGIWESEEEMCPYTIMAICPVKESKAALKYNREKEFRGVSTGSVLGSPILGILNPASENDPDHIRYFFASDKHPELADALGEAPESEKEISEKFYSALCETLDEEALATAAEIASDFAAEDSISKDDIMDKISEKFSAAKAEEFSAAFQEDHIPKLNDKITVETPNIKAVIRSDKLESKTIDGTEYILIPVEDILSLNGAKIGK